VGNGLAGNYSLYDANNNRVQVSNVCNSGCLHWTQMISDDSGREIVVTETGDYWSGNITTTVTTAGPNGPMAWTLNWELNQLGADGRRYVKAVANQWWPSPRM
jgi:hypothetical protein